MKFGFKVIKKDKKTRARLGVITTAHGKIETPTFSPVGTKAVVKGLDPTDLRNAGTQVVLGNAYHLYLRPGINTITKFGGFAPFMKWDGPTITDSGGYQVSFIYNKGKESKLGVKIEDYGMHFHSHLNGTKHLLTPKKSMEIQRVLGADIIMALDQPLSPRFSAKINDEAIARTFKWEEESFKVWQKLESSRKSGTYQALFGIIQGGIDKKVRRQFLNFILSTGFPGIAIGDESIGSDPEITAKSLDTIAEFLPDDKPLHALGLGGGPEGVFEAVERGVDIFDNSSVTRMARSGLLNLYPEDGGNCQNKFRSDFSKSKYIDDKAPISKICKCYACTTFSTAYIHHLLVSNEPLGVRLATIHNIHFYNALMASIRSAINNSDFCALKKYWLGK